MNDTTVPMGNWTLNYKAGDTIDEFKLVCECGQGSYGTVFIAENQLTTGSVALKIVYKHGSKPERELKGLRQYQIISANTNLLQIYNVKDSEEFFYYTMDAADNLNPGGEYVPDTLGNRLKAGRMQPANVRKMFEELQENLQVFSETRQKQKRFDKNRQRCVQHQDR